MSSPSRVAYRYALLVGKPWGSRLAAKNRKRDREEEGKGDTPDLDDEDEEVLNKSWSRRRKAPGGSRFLKHTKRPARKKKGREFDTQDALDQYFRDHPKAHKDKHWVGEEDRSTAKKDEKPNKPPKDKPSKARVRDYKYKPVGKIKVTSKVEPLWKEDTSKPEDSAERWVETGPRFKDVRKEVYEPLRLGKVSEADISTMMGTTHFPGESKLTIEYGWSNGKGLLRDKDGSLIRLPGGRLKRGPVQAEGPLIMISGEGEGSDSEDGGTSHYRSILQDLDGNVFILNGSFGVGKEDRGGGIGTKALYHQVLSARKAGISYLKLSAAKSPDDCGKPGVPCEANGYYTWPRLGYDGLLSSVSPFIETEDKSKPEDSGERYKTERRPIEDDIKAAVKKGALPKEALKATRVQEIMHLEGGREWWKANGRSFEGLFDLTQDEPQQLLEAYIEAQGERFGISPEEWLEMTPAEIKKRKKGKKASLSRVASRYRDRLRL